MEIMPWRSRQMSPLSSLQSEMNRMFEDFFSQPLGLAIPRTRVEATAVVPALDVKEDENCIVVTAELPGINQEDVEINVQEDMLEIRGHKREEQKNEQENYCMIERSYGAFARRVALPADVNSDQAEARMENGVLTLRLPKAAPKAGKKTITIQGSQQQQQGIRQGQQPSAGQMSAGEASSGQVSSGERASSGQSSGSRRDTSSSGQQQQQQANP